MNDNQIITAQAIGEVIMSGDFSVGESLQIFQVLSSTIISECSDDREKVREVLLYHITEINRMVSELCS